MEENKAHDCIEEENTNENVTIDYDFWEYISTVFLNISEESFWKCTLRKLNAKYKIYRQVNGLENKNKNEKYNKCFCDDIDWL